MIPWISRLNEVFLTLCNRRDITIDGHRIVGGSQILISDVPYQISFHLFDLHVCGGSIISTSWIISAAHCFPDYFPISYMVVYSSTSKLTEPGKVNRIQRVIVHKRYHSTRRNTPVNDIAVVSLKKPITFITGQQEAIALFPAGMQIPEGTEAIISGWGLLDENHDNASINLYKAKLPIISGNTCRQKVGELPAGQICAGYAEGGIDACQGDSGGPLAVEEQLAGIVSWGIGCARPGLPGVYTEVAYFRRWIKRHTGV